MESKSGHRVPTCVTGSITEAGISFCLDSATHLIDTPTGAFRLFAHGPLKKKLDDYVNTKVVITVCGYLESSAECTHINVYHVSDPGELFKSLGLS